jgi:TRAP-type mannitol/chloroaromatic compound transport system substrate-binding protein
MIRLSAIVGLALTAGLATPAWAGGTTTIDVASTFPLSLPLFSQAVASLTRQVESLTDGEVRLAFHEPGGLAPAAETLDLVASGKLAAAWATAGQFATHDSAFELLSSIPFGPDTVEYMAWLFEGGGLALSRDMFGAYGVHSIPCMVFPPEGAGWFSKEIRSVDDLRGLRIRYFGLGGRVLAKVGADVVQMPAGDIVGAMRRGEIEAAEYSLPSMDLVLGLQDVAKYYYFPGWHQQSTLYELYVNQAVWGKMTPKQQETIEAACAVVMRDGIGRAQTMQTEALQELKARGIKLRRWSPDLLMTFEAAWAAVADEQMATSPKFREVYESYDRFHKNYEFWKRFSYLR